MPGLTNSHNATEWLEGGGPQDLDDSLTCLQWLQNFSVLSAAMERPGHGESLQRGADPPVSPPVGDTPASGASFKQDIPVASCASAQQPQQDVDYRTDRWVKPPYSYATLIRMAMRASKKSKVTLAAIYTWITDNFCYYRHAEPSWQNSIRHNLSLNKCFVKVPRGKHEPGKGGFWKMDPQYDHMFVDGVFKRCRTVQDGAQSVPRAADQTPKRRHSRGRGPTQGAKHKHCLDSLLLLPKPSHSELLKGDLNWGSELEGVPDCRASNFEDLDIDAALSSLGCETETPPQFGQPVSRGHCYGNASRYAEMSSVPSEASDSTLEDPQLGHVEEVTLYQEQPQPWEELKEELQAVPLTLGHTFSFCNGFFLADVLEPYL